VIELDHSGRFCLVTLEEVRSRAEADAKTYGYHLNPDSEVLNGLIEGLKMNWDRYGYPSCPCRLASGKFEFDRDIFCPCDYRDPDVAEYGGCYCILYVNDAVYEGKVHLVAVPERRPLEKQARAYASASVSAEVKRPEAKSEAEPAAKAAKAKEEVKGVAEVKKKLWYCKQCGYVVFREDPPYICPICKAKREMFAEIRANVNLADK
jgi:ferredoxin-thioredoxin reductase catalytic subunit/rubredoxin